MITQKEFDLLKELAEHSLSESDEKIANSKDFSIIDMAMFAAKKGDTVRLFAKLKKLIDFVPTVAVGIQGGCALGATSDSPVKVIVVDYDLGKDDRGVDIQQGDGTFGRASVSEYLADVEPSKISDIRDATVGLAA
jgi:hypothetical protein